MSGLYGIETITESNSIIRLNTTLDLPNKLIVNNTFSIGKTLIDSGLDNGNINTTGYIELKDRIDGQFKTIYLEDNDLYLVTQSYHSNGEVDGSSTTTSFVREDNGSAITFGNVNVEYDTGRINFLNSDNNISIFNAGFKYNIATNKIQFKHSSLDSWEDVGSGIGGGATTLNNLTDVIITTPVSNNEILLYSSTTSNFENIAFSINIDATPSLGGNLTVGNYYITFNNISNGIVDETSNSLIRFSSSNSTPNNYFLIQHNLVSSEKIPQLTVDGSSSDIPLEITSKGNGDININCNSGEINFTASNVQFDTTNSVQFNSGFIKKNITEYTSGTLSTNSGSPTSMNIATNILTFNISGDNGRYYANLPDGVDGQTMDIFFDFPATNSNNQVEVSFGVNKKVGTGSGLSDKLIFATPGQGASFVYLVFNSGDLSNVRNRWQVINTGAIVS